MNKNKLYVDEITGRVVLLKDLGLQSYPGFPMEEGFVGSLTGSDIPMFNTATGGAPSPTQGTPSFNHDGIRRMRTGSGPGVGQCIDSLTGAVGGGGINISRCVGEVIWLMKTIAPVPAFSALNSQEAAFGWASTNSFTPTFGMFWYFNFALFGTTWRFRVIGTGGTYDFNTGVQWSTSADQWNTFGIRIYTGAPFAGNQRIELYHGIEGVSEYQLIGTITEAMLLAALPSVAFPANGVPNFNLIFANRKPSITTVQRELQSDYIYIDKRIV